jgi:ribulose bisphosphate carboxylase small subunit
MKSFREFDEVRKILKRDYKIEFEELANKFRDGYWVFENITDDRDIRCVVTRVEHYSTLP